MKRVLSVVLAVFLIFALAPTVFANISVTLDGSPIYFGDVPPQMIDNRTMVPLRAIFEALNAEIEWDGYTQTVTANRAGRVVVMQVGNPVITVAGNYVELDVPPLIIDNRTLVPARAVAESFGVNVEWNGYTQTVVLTAGTVQVPVDSNPLVGRWGTYFIGTLHQDWGIMFNADGTGYYFWNHDAEDMHFLWRGAGYGVYERLWAIDDWNWANEYWLASSIPFSFDGTTLEIDGFSTYRRI